MKYNYSVAFGKTEERELEDFNSLTEAKKFAKKKVKEGEKTVIIDIFDEDNDLVNYILLN